MTRSFSLLALMMTLTHLAISGLATSLIVGTADLIIIGVGAITGLFPDVDVGKSPAGRILFPLSRFLEKRFPIGAVHIRSSLRW
jgi:inner membrane protein